MNAVFRKSIDLGDDLKWFVNQVDSITHWWKAWTLASSEYIIQEILSLTYGIMVGWYN